MTITSYKKLITPYVNLIVYQENFKIYHFNVLLKTELQL